MTGLKNQTLQMNKKVPVPESVGPCPLDIWCLGPFPEMIQELETVDWSLMDNICFVSFF